jgi:hypothetical protein
MPYPVFSAPGKRAENTEPAAEDRERFLKAEK